MKEFTQENITSKPINVNNAGKPRITVIGVGGGGCNMVSHAAKVDNSGDVNYIAANTDLQHLNSIKDINVKKIQLGTELCRGLG